MWCFVDMRESGWVRQGENLERHALRPQGGHRSDYARRPSSPQPASAAPPLCIRSRSPATRPTRIGSEERRRADLKSALRAGAPYLGKVRWGGSRIRAGTGILLIVKAHTDEKAAAAARSRVDKREQLERVTLENVALDNAIDSRQVCLPALARFANPRCPTFLQDGRWISAIPSLNRSKHFA